MKWDLDHSNFYKEKHLIEVMAYSSEVQFIIIMVGSKSAVAESPAYILHTTESQLRHRVVSWEYKTSKPAPTMTHFLQQGHTS